MTVSDAVIPFVKVWEIIVRAFHFLKDKLELVWEFLLDRLVTYLCRHYQPSFEFAR
jgi:hypothetical protein